jgi:hypothetical protein
MRQSEGREPGKWVAVALALANGVALLACSPATTFIASKRMPDAEPLDLKGDRVAAVVMMQDQDVRRTAEDVLARQITKHGAQGVAMYTLLASNSAADEADARTALEHAQVKGAVVMRPHRAQKEVVTPPSTYSSPIYNAYWGAYYPYGWNSSYPDPVNPYRTTYGAQQSYTVDVQVPGHVETYDVVRVEVLIYSFKQNRLVWAGEAETDDPGKVESFVEELAGLTAEELNRLFLLRN